VCRLVRVRFEHAIEFEMEYSVVINQQTSTSKILQTLWAFLFFCHGAHAHEENVVHGPAPICEQSRTSSSTFGHPYSPASDIFLPFATRRVIKEEWAEEVLRAFWGATG
jgi:hypothetical protein